MAARRVAGGRVGARTVVGEVAQHLLLDVGREVAAGDVVADVVHLGGGHRVVPVPRAHEVVDLREDNADDGRR